jgi:ferrochelatase
VGLVLAPHYSAVSVGDYTRRASEAASRRPEGVDVTVIPHWHLAPGLAPLLARRVRAAVDGLGVPSAEVAVVFTAHSVPARLSEAGDPYADEVRASAAAVADDAGVARWSVAYQSAGRTDDEWLGPDVRDVVFALAADDVPAVVVCPIGFVSDHLEVLYDLDVEAAAVAGRAGIAFARTASLNDDPAFCAVLAGVVMAASPLRDE